MIPGTDFMNLRFLNSKSGSFIILAMKYHFLKHLHTVNRHRFHVFVNCVRCGIPLRGLLHDLSKYSPTEFIISARNYTGVRSPIANERKEEFGYSKVFIHHTRRNRHHYEYWVDVTTGDIILIPMPYPFALECCCDMISASMVYNGKKFTRDMPLQFFLRVKEKSMMHSATKTFIQMVLESYRDSGFEKLKKKQTKIMYQKSLEGKEPTEKILVYSRKDNEKKQ